MQLRSYLGIALFAAVAGNALAADDAFPESMVTLRGQPAVFTVVRSTDLEAEYPKSVSLNLEALKADRNLAKVGSRRNATDAERYWLLLGQDPEKYLVTSKERVRNTFKGAMTGRGSAFAISREGILLTNAHVVDNAVDPTSPDSWLLIQGVIAKDCEAFEKTLGVPDISIEDAALIVGSIRAWYAKRIEIVGSKVRSVRVVLDYKVDSKKRDDLAKKRHLTEALSLIPEEISVPATVLAIGEPMPGKDVAVIKVTFEPEEHAKLTKLAKERNLKPELLATWLADIQNDRLICLSLGNSEEVLPQAKVQALGLPGIAFSADLMEPEARYKVSARGGQVSQTKRMKGGWDAIEMNTAIEHGDSGGPVLDVQGRVIGLNVGSAKDKPGALRLAVPINLAKEMLVKAGITPDPGKASAHWEKCLKLFADGKYEACLEAIKLVRRIQEGEALSGRETSWYVKDMAGRCLQKLGKIPSGK